jgi:hypothetical protein
MKYPIVQGNDLIVERPGSFSIQNIKGVVIEWLYGPRLVWCSAARLRARAEERLHTCILTACRRVAVYI